MMTEVLALRGARKPRQGAALLGALVLFAMGLVAAPAHATNVTNFGDTTTTPPDDSLRGVITGINASPPTAGSPIRFIMNGRDRNIGLAADMPALTRFVEIQIWDSATTEFDPANGPLVLTISGGSGSYTAFNSSQGMRVNVHGAHILRMSSCGEGFRTTGGDACIFRRVEVVGNTSVGITVASNGQDFHQFQAVYIDINGGTGIQVTGSQNTILMEGVTVRYCTSRGMDVQGFSNFYLQSLAPDAVHNSWWGGAAPVTAAYPPVRQHNFIGGTGQWGQVRNSGGYPRVYPDGNPLAIPPNPSSRTVPYQGGGYMTSNGIYLNTGNVSGGDLYVSDTDIGAINGTGLEIDPNVTICTIVLRRIHVGVTTETYRAYDGRDQAHNRGLTGDGIVIHGGRAEVYVGNAADEAYNSPDDEALDLTASPAEGLLRHSAGDNGITCSGTSGIGLQIGDPDLPIRGHVLVRYVRCGMDAVGDRELSDARYVDQGRRRWQNEGLYVNADATGGGAITDTGITIQHSQFTGNRDRGGELHGYSRLTFDNNIVGLDAGADNIPAISDSHLLDREEEEQLPLGNGDLRYWQNTNYPKSFNNYSGHRSGDGMIVDTEAEILSFNGNTIAGNAYRGLVITNNCPGTIDVPGNVGSIGNGTALAWNHIGVQGRGLEAGNDTPNAGVGQKLPEADSAVGDGSGGPLFTPRRRGNGTILFSDDQGTPAAAFGDGFTYSGNNVCRIQGITVSDNAENGLVISTPQNNNNANVTLVKARLGTDDTGIAPTDQTMGNGTVGRSPTNWSQVNWLVGSGIQISGDGDNQIGVGTNTDFPNATDNRSVISSNLVYGVQLTGTVGLASLDSGDAGNSSNAIQNCQLGTDLNGTAGNSANAEILGFGNGHARDPNAYPPYFGAGVRVEPNAEGRHLIGDGDGGATQNGRCIISNNGLAGVWLRGVANCVVVGNHIGAEQTGTAALGTRQMYGVLIEQPEFPLHAAITGTGSGEAMGSQYVGWLPFDNLTGESATPTSRFIPNVIVNNKLWGVAVEDDGDHAILSNKIGVATGGTVAIPNGLSGGALPTPLANSLFPNTFQRTGGVEIGALNTLQAGQVSVGHDEVGANNIISGNYGYGLGQYRDGSLLATNNLIGVDSAGTTAVAGYQNQSIGVYLAGNGNNQLLRNTISGNASDGVRIDGSGANVLRGNRVGTVLAGTAALANQGNGIWITAAAGGDNRLGDPGSDTINGTLVYRRNQVSGNALNGILIEGTGANNVVSNYVGLNAAGAAALGNAQSGIVVAGKGAATIGGGTVQNGVNVDANVVSGNGQQGLWIRRPTAGNGGAHTIRGNLLGLAAAGATAVANGQNGLAIMPDPNDANTRPVGNNLVWDNTISGNTQNGVYLDAAGQNTLRGNRIGTSLDGTADVGNQQDGVYVAPNCAQAQFLGLANTSTSAFDRGNLISGNGANGISLADSQAHLVYGNRIGTNLAGTAALPNDLHGIYCNMSGGAPTIGGTLTGQFNLISGNTQSGLALAGPLADPDPPSYTIRGNWIGLNAAGTGALGNERGVDIDAPSTNTLASNRISGNRAEGVQITRGDNTLTLNRIGTNVGGDAAVANGTVGILLQDTAGTQVIGLPTEGNVIAGNTSDGVSITGSGTYSFVSNLIGQNVAGTGAIANGRHGLYIDPNSGGTVVVGGTGENEQNSIGGNVGYGIDHEGNQAPVIVNNRVGTNASGSAPIGNSAGGLRYASRTWTTLVTLGAAPDGQGGQTVSGNLISGNGGPGVVLGGGCRHAVALLGNKIGTNLSGAVALGQAGHGVVIENGNAQANAIGNATGGGNTISGNGIDPNSPTDPSTWNNQIRGIYIVGNGSNQIVGNSIGGSSAGNQLAAGVGNVGDGVRIAASGGNLIQNNTIRDNGGAGVALQDGRSEKITNNRFVGNGLDANGNVVALPIDIDADGVVDAPGTGTANLGLDFPVLKSLVPSSVDPSQWVLSGTVNSSVTTLELYRASDSQRNTLDADLTKLLHHGGASELLQTVTIPRGNTSFATNLSGLTVGDLVTALAFDANGNTSEFSRNIGLLDTTQSTVTALPNSPVADGTQKSTVTVTLMDLIGTPMVGVSDVSLAFAPALAGLQPPNNPLPATSALGVTFGDVRSTTRGDTTVTVTTSGLTLGQTPVIHFATAGVDVNGSSFVVDKTEVQANSPDQATFTFTLVDSAGQPLEGVPANELSIQATPATGVKIVGPSAATNAAGQATATATCSLEQSVIFRGMWSGREIPAPQTVAFVGVPLDPSRSNLAVVPATVAADGQSVATLTLTLVNVDGDPVSGIQPNEVSFSVNAEAVDTAITEQAGASDAQGKFTATIASGTVQTVTVSATVRSQAIGNTVEVSFEAGVASAANSTLQLAPETPIADGNEVVTATVTVADSRGRVRSGEPVTLVVEPNQGVTISQPSATDANGSTTGTFTATAAGTYQVRAILGALPGTATIGPQQVTFKPNPPSASLSTVELSSSAIVADGQEVSTLTITLVDRLDRPVVGVEPGDLEVLPVGQVGGLTVRGPLAATDTEGVTTAEVRGTQPGSVEFGVTARNVKLDQTATLTLRDYVDYSYPSGTHLMGLAATPLDPNPGVVLKGLGGDLRLARWLPADQAYLAYVAGSQAPALEMQPGRGFFLQLNHDFQFRVVGTRTPNGTFNLLTGEGWNMLANPYDGDLPFRLEDIAVYQNGELVGTLDSAAAQALVDPYAWIYDPVLGYLLVIDPSTAGSVNVPGMIAKNRGFWVMVRQPNVSLRINGPQLSRSRAQRSQDVTPTEWLINLQAEAAGKISRANLFGVSNQPLSAELPPAGPVQQPVSVRFINRQGRAVATDLRPGPITQPTQWRAVVSAPENSDVTLSWPGINRGLPRGHQVWLIDPDSGRRVLLNSRAAYQYRQATGDHEFIVEVDPRGKRSLTVSQMQINPGSSRSKSVMVDYTITTTANVVLTVRGLTGREVRVVRETAEAGTNSIGWDRKDDQGRLVPSGIYRIDLIATTDEGETVRVTRQVRID